MLYPTINKRIVLACNLCWGGGVNNNWWMNFFLIIITLQMMGISQGRSIIARDFFLRFEGSCYLAVFWSFFF